MYPAVRDIKKELGNDVEFIVANFKDDETLKLAELYGVRYVPDFIVFDIAGNIAAREGGTMSVEALRAMVLRGLGR